MHELKRQLKADIKEFESNKRQLNGSSLELLHLLTDTLKNICKIEMLEKESEYSEGGNSYARGRTRDRMGRYTSYGMGEHSEENGYSEDQGSYRSSYGGAKDHMMSKLGSMMEGADPESREILKKCMRDLEKI